MSIPGGRATAGVATGIVVAVVAFVAGLIDDLGQINASGGKDALIAAIEAVVAGLVTMLAALTATKAGPGALPSASSSKVWQPSEPAPPAPQAPPSAPYDDQAEGPPLPSE